MNYIDWYHEKIHTEDTQKSIHPQKFPGYRYWEDLITETQYYISDADYGRIYEAGKEALEEHRSQNDVKAIEDIFYNSGGNSDLDLFPELPDFPDSLNTAETTIRCARLRDYVCFRTACLYALKYRAIQNLTDEALEVEKAKLRLQGFTWKIIGAEEEIPEMNQIEKMLKSTCPDDGSDTNLLEKKADLVKGGIVKIKQYYLETNKIPEIRGASLLLDKANSQEMERIICQEHIRECLIYAGGGKMMGIFPAGCGTEICSKIERMIEYQTVTAQSNFYSQTYSLKRLMTDYRSIMDEMDLALEERQGLRWDFRTEPKVELKMKESYMISRGYKRLQEEKEVYCTSCRNRYAVVEGIDKNREEKLCQSCLYKRLQGGADAKRSVRQKYRDFVEKQTGNKIQEDVVCNTLEDIAGKENGFIGVIYGDANNMSRQINRLESFMMMRYFSQATADAIRDIVFGALYEHLGEQQRFEVIAIGGDDIFLIVPGKYAYDIACAIGKSFDKKFRNQSENRNQMTMSMGVCITHCSMPVQYSFDIAQELLKSAKQKAWEIRREEADGTLNHNSDITGTIDWMVIENEASGSAVLEYQRRGAEDKPAKTLRPYTWKQAGAMKEFIQQLNTEKSFVFQLSRSWYKHTKEEAELFYEYQLSRKKDDSSDNKIRCALKSLSEGFCGTVQKNNIIYQGCSGSPWLDAIELWDYVEGME